MSEPIRHHFVEIRDSSQGHKLVTLIEILSPSNKRRGPDREAYRAKQREVLESDAHLIEIDLLRSGDRVLPDLNLTALIDQLDQPADYLVLVNRAWRRAGGLAYQVFPCRPTRVAPLHPGPPEAGRARGAARPPVRLQPGLRRRPLPSRRRRLRRPPEPPLSGDDAGWAEALIAGRAG